MIDDTDILIFSKAGKLLGENEKIWKYYDDLDDVFIVFNIETYIKLFSKPDKRFNVSNTSTAAKASSAKPNNAPTTYVKPTPAVKPTVDVKPTAPTPADVKPTTTPAVKPTTTPTPVAKPATASTSTSSDSPHAKVSKKKVEPIDLTGKTPIEIAFITGKFRDCVNLCNRELVNDSENIEALIHKGCILYHNRQFSKALTVFKNYVEYSTPGYESKKLSQTEIDYYGLAHYAIAKILFKPFDKSCHLLDCMLHEETNTIVKKSLDESFEMEANVVKVIEYLDKALKICDSNKESKDNITVTLIKVLLRCKDESCSKRGLALLDKAIKTEQTAPVLLEYAYVMILQNAMNDAFTVTLKAMINLVQNGEQRNDDDEKILDNKTLKSLFLFDDLVARSQIQMANCMGQDRDQSYKNGLVMLNAAMAEAATNASTISFIANQVKKIGAVKLAIEIFRRANELATFESSYALSLIHCVELRAHYTVCANEVLKSLNKLPKIQIKSVVNSNVLAIPAVLEILPAKFESVKLDEPLQLFLDASETIPEIFDAGYCQIKQIREASNPVNALMTKYSTFDIDMVALLLTLVKVLFLSKQLVYIPKLMKIIEKFREGQKFSETSIKNEHAYYCCIAQLMPYLHEHAKKLAASPQAIPVGKPIYVVGDSHCMSSAWHYITVNGESRLLIPKLVTGMKCYHLRVDCNFYPKTSFDDIVNSIPDGSDVIFNFGEIDCRDGLTSAMDKGCHKSMEDGVEVVMKYYLEELARLAMSKDFKCYIHPVAPVLDLTRDNTKLFCITMKSKVASFKNKYIKYLNFHEKLLTDDKEKLNPKYVMDGTHLPPTYLELLEESFNNILSK